METLANLESFVRSAETGRFSAAARRLSLTPAAVSRNVAMLERNLGVRLFQRSTRKLTLTEAGERFLLAIRDNLEELQAGDCKRGDGPRRAGGRAQGQHGPDLWRRLHPAAAAGVPGTLSRRSPDWQFETRQVDLIAEGFDAAIGGGIESGARLGIARACALAHHRGCLAGLSERHERRPPTPSGLAAFDGIVMRSITNRAGPRAHRCATPRVTRSRALKETIAFDDPEAMCRAALLGLGVTLIAVPHALPHLESGALVRLVPQWYADAGPISIYYASRTAARQDARLCRFRRGSFRRERLAERFAGSIG